MLCLVIPKLQGGTVGSSSFPTEKATGMKTNVMSAMNTKCETGANGQFQLAKGMTQMRMNDPTEAGKMLMGEYFCTLLGFGKCTELPQNRCLRGDHVRNHLTMRTNNPTPPPAPLRWTYLSHLSPASPGALNTSLRWLYEINPVDFQVNPHFWLSLTVWLLLFISYIYIPPIWPQSTLGGLQKHKTTIKSKITTTLKEDM